MTSRGATSVGRAGRPRQLESAGRWGSPAALRKEEGGRVRVVFRESDFLFLDVTRPYPVAYPAARCENRP